MNKLTQKEFLKRAKEIFPQYDFSEAEYRGGKEKVKVKHFEPVEYYGGEDAFKLQVERDKIR